MTIMSSKHLWFCPRLSLVYTCHLLRLLRNAIVGEAGLVKSSLLFTLLKAGSLRKRCQHGQVPVRALFRVIGCRLLVGSLHGRRGSGALRPLL